MRNKNVRFSCFSMHTNTPVRQQLTGHTHKESIPGNTPTRTTVTTSSSSTRAKDRANTVLQTLLMEYLTTTNISLTGLY